MPLNKDQLLRYQVLNRCFRNRSQLYDIHALVHACQQATLEVNEKSVSKRTVQNDIQRLKMDPYNVEFDDTLLKQHYYRYADTSFNLDVVADLSQREKTALHDTVELIRPLTEDPDISNPLMQWMFMSLQRLEVGKPLAEESPCVAFENNGALAGMGNFGPLLECIMNRQPVTLRYRSFRSTKARDINVHPYLLKQYNSRWYLIATPEGYATIAAYALDRILTVTLWKTDYLPCNSDLDALFADTIGVTLNPQAPVEQLILKVAANRYPYIQTKPFSERQKIVSRVDNTVTITFPMRLNPELVSEILSFGSDIEVVEPMELRLEIERHVEEMSKKYLGVQKIALGGE